MCKREKVTVNFQYYDILYCGTQQALKHIETSIQQKFKLRTSEEAMEFIGIEHQSLRITLAAQKFDMKDHKKVGTSLEETAL